MKKINDDKVVVFFALLSVCDNKASGVSYKSDLIIENEMNIEMMSSRVQDIATSNDGIYYIIGDYLYFYGFESQKMVILCNKPNCKHNLETDQMIGQECNAYL